MFGSNGISAGAVRQAVNATSVSTGTSASRNASVNQASNSPSLAVTPWLLVAFFALYIIWAAIEQHERIRESVEPSNIAFNLRNLAIIGLTATLGIVILKVVFTKLVAWGVPGSAAINQIVAAA